MSSCEDTFPRALGVPDSREVGGDAQGLWWAPSPSYLPTLPEGASDPCRPLAPLSLASCLGSRVVWPFLQLNSKLVGLVEGKALALPGELFAGGGEVGEGLQVIGTSACGHLDAQILTYRPLSGQLALPAAFMLGQGAEVWNITQAPDSPCRQIFCDLTRPLHPGDPSFITCGQVASHGQR